MSSLKSIKDNSFYDEGSDFFLDLSTAMVTIAELESQYSKEIVRCLEEMQALEAGEIANPDEQRMVGHYWLRDPEGSPNAAIKQDIKETVQAVQSFAAAILSGKESVAGNKVQSLIIAGIGGSALGPQFLEAALQPVHASIKVYYLDNTDPAGFVDTLEAVEDLASSLSIVISKSGGTRETRNAMLWLERCYRQADLQPGEHLVAVTQLGSALDTHAKEGAWRKRFPMWDWVGGRVSIWSAVGLLPAALMQIDTDELLLGAAQMDALTRSQNLRENPALLLALTWYHLGNRRGERSLILLPYRDQLEKLSKYCQQLVMESIGKAHDIDGNLVNQGLYVLGNKGSTDQHSYVQQLRDGLDNFIAHFIEVRSDRSNLSPREDSNLQCEPIENGASVGDYLLGFEQGTRQALYEAQRPGVLLSVAAVSERSIGSLVALFERAVGFYASLIRVNAYNQPGVEAGKKAALRVLEVQEQLLKHLSEAPGSTVEEIVSALHLQAEAATVFAVIRHLEENDRLQVDKKGCYFERRYTTKRCH